MSQGEGAATAASVGQRFDQTLYAVEQGFTGGPEVAIETEAGVRSALCEMHGRWVRCVRIDMGPPILNPESIPVRADGDRMVDYHIDAEGRMESWGDLADAPVGGVYR